MKKYILLSIVVLSLFFSLYSVLANNYCVGSTYNFTCGVDNINESCTLNGNVSSSINNCYNITGANVIIDCNGYNINATNGADGFYSVDFSVSNITIKNCFITVYDSSGWGIGLLNGLPGNNLIKNNTIFNYGSSGYGIAISSGTNNNVTDNTINAYNSSTTGILFISNCNNSFITNNNITTVYEGIGLQSLNNDTIANNIIITNTGAVSPRKSIKLNGASNNTILITTILIGLIIYIPVIFYLLRKGFKKKK